MSEASDHVEDSDPEDPDVFCFEILEGDHLELVKFLKASAVWLASLAQPPGRTEFKLFLEGGWASLNVSKFSSCGGNCHDDDHEAVVTTIKGMALAFAEFVDKTEINDSLFLGAETQMGPWRNITLDSFLDAASDGTDFKRGVYDTENPWPWISEFYVNGQTLE